MAVVSSRNVAEQWLCFLKISEQIDPLHDEPPAPSDNRVERGRRGNEWQTP
jgi:hypothetical protein